MIVDAISDLHGHYPKLEGGDLLIIAGDLTASDLPGQYLKFFHWIANTHYKKRIVIAGNHDGLAQTENLLDIAKGDFEYLCDSGTEFEGLKIWGSPWTKTFKGMNPKCKAFTCETEDELESHFRNIPDNIDILITHSPPFGILDAIRLYCYGNNSDFDIEHVGSKSLANKIRHMKTPPKLWVYGHIHEDYGKYTHPINGITYVNASHVNERYEPVNKPVRIIL